MGSMSRVPRLIAVSFALLVPLGIAGTAAATPPVAVTGQVTDSVDVLTPSQESQVQASLDKLQSEDGTQLYVVYVDSFDGLSGKDWAAQSFHKAGLGNKDV